MSAVNVAVVVSIYSFNKHIIKNSFFPKIYLFTLIQKLFLCRLSKTKNNIKSKTKGRHFKIFIERTNV